MRSGAALFFLLPIILNTTPWFKQRLVSAQPRSPASFPRAAGPPAAGRSPASFPRAAGPQPCLIPARCWPAAMPHSRALLARSHASFPRAAGRSPASFPPAAGRSPASFPPAAGPQPCLIPARCWPAAMPHSRALLAAALPHSRALLARSPATCLIPVRCWPRAAGPRAAGRSPASFPRAAGPQPCLIPARCWPAAMPHSRALLAARCWPAALPHASFPRAAARACVLQVQFNVMGIKDSHEACYMRQCSQWSSPPEGEYWRQAKQMRVEPHL